MVTQLRNPGAERWDFSAGLLPHSINPTDIDLLYERRGFYLALEGKRPGEEIPKGQRICLDALAREPRFTVVHFVGIPPAEIHMHALWGEALQPSSTTRLCALISEWYEWVEGIAFKASA